MKIPILALFLLLLFPGPLRGEAGGELSAFSGSESLRREIWRLAAFPPPAALPAQAPRRTLTVDDVEGLPPVTITLDFDEFLDPWPARLSIVFQAEASEPPVLLTLEDQRPFGGPHLRVNGDLPENFPERGGNATDIGDGPAAALADMLARLNERLLEGRPRLGEVRWRENAPGFEMARARLLFGARLGPDDLFLARFDPEQYSFRPYRESEFPDSGPAPLAAWAERFPAAVALINGGQYYPDRSPMGRLTRDGRELSSQSHPHWKGFLAAGPTEGAPTGAPPATIIDAQAAGAARPEEYRDVLQSFMLLDHYGLIRVRDSRLLAGRAAVGQDRAGRLLLIMTPAAVTLYDLALALQDPRLDLARVMGLDGGFEAQMLLRQNGAPFQAAGQFSISDKRAVYLPGYQASLPVVIAVEPVKPKPAE